MSVLEALFSPRRDPADCVIRLGTPPQEITELYPMLTEVTVESTRTQAAAGRLRFQSFREEQGAWRVQDDPLIATWQPVHVAARFGRAEEDVLKGFVREVKADYPEDAGRASVTVECQDVSLKLDREHVRKSWGDPKAPTSDAAILAQILPKHGLRPAPGSGGGRKSLQLNQDGTDARFLRDRAEASGLELLFSGDTVYFGPMRLSAAAQPEILVYGGPATNCLSFSSRIDGHTPEKVAFDLADPGNQRAREVVVTPSLRRLGPRPAIGAGPGLKDFVWRMTREGSAGQDELQAKAQQKADAASMRVRAEGELDGSLYGHVLRVAEPVRVGGVGDDLSGTWYVDSVSHRFTADGYRQRFTLLRNALGDDRGAAPFDRLAAVR